MLQKIRQLVQKLAGKGAAEPVPEPEEDELCCSGTVHIAYRGVSDDRMYIAYKRTWNEVRFFRPNGLRVFCADCRRRLL